MMNAFMRVQMCVCVCVRGSYVTVLQRTHQQAGCCVATIFCEVQVA